MTLLTTPPRPSDAPSDPRPGAAEATVLAAALTHLLRRDGDRPARWARSPFAELVEATRVEMDRHGSRPTALAVHGPDGTRLTFGAAVDHLARYPSAVATAIRRIEMGRSHRLPAWPELVRRGLPAGPSALEASLWFG
jgi:hypothetical protein